MAVFRTQKPHSAGDRIAHCRGLALRLWKMPRKPLVFSSHWKVEEAEFWRQQRKTITSGANKVKEHNTKTQRQRDKKQKLPLGPPFIWATAGRYYPPSGW